MAPAEAVHPAETLHGSAWFGLTRARGGFMPFLCNRPPAMPEIINVNDYLGPFFALNAIGLGIVVLLGEYLWNSRTRRTARQR